MRDPVHALCACAVHASRKLKQQDRISPATAVGFGTSGTTGTIFCYYCRRVPIDLIKHYFGSKFEINTTVHKQAEWRENLAAAM